MQMFVAHHLVGPEGAWYWPYMLSSSAANDLPHASYIAYSIETYARYGGRMAPLLPLPQIRQHLRDFVVGDSGEIRAYPIFTGILSPARSYDIGFALVTVCAAAEPMDDVRRALTAAVARYRTLDGHYAKIPIRPGEAPPVINEYETYLLYGAASCLDADSRH